MGDPNQPAWMQEPSAPTSPQAYQPAPNAAAGYQPTANLPDGKKNCHEKMRDAPLDKVLRWLRITNFLCGAGSVTAGVLCVMNMGKNFQVFTMACYLM